MKIKFINNYVKINFKPAMIITTPNVFLTAIWLSCLIPKCVPIKVPMSTEKI